MTVRLFILIYIFSCFEIASQAMAANTSRCYSIENNDRKNYCLATVKRESSYCYSIQTNNLKQFCLAEVKGEKSYCYSIQERDLKNQCLAAF